MSNALNRYLECKELADQLKAKADRIAGAKSQLEDQLAELGCTSLVDAKKQLAAIQKELESVEKELETARKNFIVHWGEQL